MSSALVKFSKPELTPPKDVPLLSWYRNLEDLRKNLAGQSGQALTKEVNPAANHVQLHVSDIDGTGYWEFAQFSDGFGLVVNNSNFHNTTVFRFAGEGLLKIHFRLAATTSLVLESIGQIDLDKAVCQVFYHPTGPADCEWIATGQAKGWVTLYCERNYLANTFGFDLETLPKPLYKALAQRPKTPYIDHLALDVGMRQACASIVDCDYVGRLRNRYIESQATELLCLVLARLQEQSVVRPVSLSMNDIDALHHAMDILNENFTQPPSVAELSKQIGINRNKLTYGFKSLFGTTMQDVCFTKRMEVAQRMLLDTSERIESIAEAVGYQHANNFSASFKRTFGVSPKAYRKR